MPEYPEAPITAMGSRCMSSHIYATRRWMQAQTTPSACELPEGAGQADFGEERLRLLASEGPEARIEPRAVPRARQLPPLRKIQRRAPWPLPLIAPATDVLFRP